MARHDAWRPPPPARPARIGDILLELGFASEEALAKAAIEQEKTGQPLGQILVDTGRSRASSSRARSPSSGPTRARRSRCFRCLLRRRARARPQPHDEDQYAARLQDAVAELAQRVGASQAGERTSRAGSPISPQRVEATVARAQRIEATLAALAESLQGVTGGAEEALNSLQTRNGRPRARPRPRRHHPRRDRCPACRDTGRRLSPRGPARRARGGGAGPGGAARTPTRRSQGGSTLSRKAAALAEIRSALQELESRAGRQPGARRAAGADRDRPRAAARGGPGSADVEKLATLLEKTVDKQKGLAHVVEELGPASKRSRNPTTVSIRRPPASPRWRGGSKRSRGRWTSPAGALPQESIAAPQRLDELGAGSRRSRRSSLRWPGRRSPPSESRRSPHVSTSGRHARVAGGARGEARRRRAAAAVGDGHARGPLAGAWRRRERRSLADTRVEPDPRIEQLAQELDDAARRARDAGAGSRARRQARGARALRWSSLPAVPRRPGGAGGEARRGRAAGSSDGRDAGRALAARWSRHVKRSWRNAGRAGSADRAAGRRARDRAAALRTRAHDPELAARLDASALEVEQLAGGAEAVQAALAAKLDDVERRLPSDIVTLEDLSQALGRVREEVALESATGGPDPRIEELLNEVASLRSDHKPDERVDALVQGLESVRAELAEATARIGAPDPELERRFQALAERVEAGCRRHWCGRRRRREAAGAREPAADGGRHARRAGGGARPGARAGDRAERARAPGSADRRARCRSGRASRRARDDSRS